MAKASGSIDLNAMKEASKVATNCLFEVTNGGVWLTPIDKKPNTDGTPVTSGNNKTSGTFINADGVGIYKDGTKVAQYGNTITLGQETSGSFRTKIDSDTFWITDGIVDIAYIGNGNEITDTFVSDGTTMEYDLSSTYSSGGVFSPSTVNGTKKSGENKIVISSGLPEEGKTFTYTYVPADSVTYYTMGYRTNDSAVGIYSFVEGHSNIASGKYSHCEGYNTTASGSSSHAEGEGTTASGNFAHSEGFRTTASGNGSHSEGYLTKALGINSHSEGFRTTASGNYSRAYGMYTTASGYFGSANGALTKARAGQFVIGTANIEDTDSNKNYMQISSATTIDLGNYAFIIGNGYLANNSSGIILDGNDESTIVRSNALTVDWNGTITANGYICNNIGGNSSTTHASVLSTWFNNHKSSISRNTVLSYWSSAYGNGSQYMGYFLNGYDTSPYGGFFVCHYTTPWYVGISNGNYTQYELTRTATSSRKTKENIKSMTEKEAKKLYDLDVISFDYKKGYEEGKKNQFGLIAEDCDKIIPYVVYKPDDNEDSIWGIDYTKFVPYLIKNLQLHEEKIKELEKEIEVLKSSLMK